VTVASASFRALGTTATVCAAEPEALPAARAAVERLLGEVDRACSRFRPDSELARLNASAGRETTVGGMLFGALRAALRAAAATGGLVDPTIGRSLRLAGYDRRYEQVRARDGRSLRVAFAPAGRWREVELSEERRTVRIPAGVELDLGATAKALAADLAARAASAAGGAGALVSLGGDVALGGDVPAGGWPVLLADDHAAAPGSAGPVVALRSGGLASSSTTVRRWRAGCVRLHHILDPRTGRPASTPWRTVTVAAASCLDANTASTAAVVLGEQAPAWLAERGLPARLVAARGCALHVAGWPAEVA